MIYRWICSLLLAVMTSANSLYLPRRWYTPEWNGVFMTLLCSFFSIGYCTSPIAVGWMESMNIDQFCSVEKTAFYNFHHVTDFDDAYAVRLRRDATYTIQLDVRFVDLTRNFDNLHFPLNDYMISLRIFFSEFENFDSMWNNLAESKVPNAFIPTVLDLEYQVLSNTEDRLKDTLPSIRNGKHKQFSNTLITALRVIDTILHDTEGVYLNGLLTSDKVNYEEFIHHYESRVEEEAIKSLEENNLPVRYAKDVVTAVKLYTRDSLVPFFNRYLEDRGNSLAEAPASFVLQRPYSGADDGLILITERLYKNQTFTLPLTSSDKGSNVSVTVSQATRNLFGSDLDYNATHMLENYQGYGAYSIIKMECLHLPEVIPSLQDQYNVTHTHCVTGKTYLNVYNTVVASPVLSLVTTAPFVDQTKNQRNNDTPLVSRMRRAPEGTSLEEIVVQSIEYERSLAYHSPQYAEAARFRVLSLGLGGGELHMFLLNHFPTAEVTSVEISDDIFRSSQEALGLRYGLCRAGRLTTSNSTTTAEGLVDILDLADAEYANRPEHQQQCRSQVVIADAWDYMFYQSKIKEAAPTKEIEDSLFYDFIVFDVYDQAATRWTGNTDTVSSPCVDRAASDDSLRTIRGLLRPSEGLAVFHLHSDNQFQHYYDQIKNIFGSDQVILFSVTSNDYMVVAGREKFRTPPHLHSSQNSDTCTAASAEVDGSCTASVTVDAGTEVHPCEQPINFTHFVTERNHLYGFSHRISKASLYSLNCKDKENYLLNV